jgi:hypothetical protein
LLLDADEFRPKAEALGTQRLTANAKTKTKKAGPPRFADDNQKNNGKDKTGGMDRGKVLGAVPDNRGKDLVWRKNSARADCCGPSSAG